MTQTYRGYLRLAELLDQQAPASQPPAHDELMFITVHQCYELWFKLLLHELTDARDQMLAGRPAGARLRLARCHVIERILIDMFGVLDSMTPSDFQSFRGALGTASGFQSAQYREIELLSGPPTPGLIEAMSRFSPDERYRIGRRLVEPTLWHGFVRLLADAGLPVDSEAELSAALCAVAGDPRFAELAQLAEALITHDQNWYLWRARHLITVERQIGTKTGTGGTAGYLRSRADVRFFPELWALRAML